MPTTIDFRETSRPSLVIEVPQNSLAITGASSADGLVHVALLDERAVGVARSVGDEVRIWSSADVSFDWLEPALQVHARCAPSAAGRPIPVDVLVDAFLSSALRLTRKDSIPGEVFKQLIGRAFYEPGPGTEAFFPDEYREAVDRYRQAFMRALPRLSQEDVVWRMYFLVGIVAYAMAGKDVMRMTETYALTDQGQPEAILARLRPFVVAGFLAPPGAVPGLGEIP